MAVVMASGGDGDSRAARGRESGEGERVQRVRKRSEGTRGVVVASLGGRGGRAGDGEFDGDDGRSPKRGTATWRRCRASGGPWSGGEEEGVVAELLS